MQVFFGNMQRPDFWYICKICLCQPGHREKTELFSSAGKIKILAFIHIKWNKYTTWTYQRFAFKSYRWCVVCTSKSRDPELDKIRNRQTHCIKRLCNSFPHSKVEVTQFGGSQGFEGSGEKGYLFSESWRALLIILGELGSKHIFLGI